jgi:hypothetical protein
MCIRPGDSDVSIIGHALLMHLYLIVWNPRNNLTNSSTDNRRLGRLKQSRINVRLTMMVQ